MSFEKKLLLNKIKNYSYWKNNYINKQHYSTYFFQLNLLKNIIFYFFKNKFSIFYLNNLSKKKNQKIIYISQIWINSFNNNLILSFNLYIKNRYIHHYYVFDNYLRLKYKYFYIDK